jgi:hypothetical protein
VNLFVLDIEVSEPRAVDREYGMLGYLESLTYDFERDGNPISAVLTYAEPNPDKPGTLQAVIAADTGYEGIACVDDTARAALLALKVYERANSRKALALAKRWLTFVEYMQYSDGDFANFIRNGAGVRNASGPTSVKGGYAWSSRALWALAAAYRLTGDERYRKRFQACKLAPTVDNKMNAVLALGEMELYQADPSPALRDSIVERVERIVARNPPYFHDLPRRRHVELWGYHQLHAVAEASRLLEEPRWLVSCRHTVKNLVERDVRAMFWRDYPDKGKDGVCAYMVTPLVQGLGSMYRATGARKYRDLALQGTAWFYGRNDARSAMYDPETGMCRDGITDGIASGNRGAESSIEAGFAELERRALDDLP